MWGDVMGVERDLALGDGKYLRKPLPNTTVRVANVEVNLWQMMLTPFATWSYDEQSPVLLFDTWR